MIMKWIKIVKRYSEKIKQYKQQKQNEGMLKKSEIQIGTVKTESAGLAS